MKIRVTTPDDTRAAGLVRRLAEIGATTAVLDEARVEIIVSAARPSNRILNQVLHAVQQWQEDAGVAWAEIGLGDRSHVMRRDGAAPTARLEF